MIASYFAEVERVIEEFPHALSYVLQKKVYNAKQGYIRGRLEFLGGKRREFVEVKDTDVVTKLKYRYHFMGEQEVMLSRYDNAPHHSRIASYPHHKHVGDEVHESDEPSLADVLLEIAELLRRQKIA
jgi:hypothetical protein